MCDVFSTCFLALLLQFDQVRRMCIEAYTCVIVIPCTMDRQTKNKCRREYIEQRIFCVLCICSDNVCMKVSKNARIRIKITAIDKQNGRRLELCTHKLPNRFLEHFVCNDDWHLVSSFRFECVCLTDFGEISFVLYWENPTEQHVVPFEWSRCCLLTLWYRYVWLAFDWVTKIGQTAWIGEKKHTTNKQNNIQIEIITDKQIAAM